MCHLLVVLSNVILNIPGVTITVVISLPGIRCSKTEGSSEEKLTNHRLLESPFEDFVDSDTQVQSHTFNHSVLMYIKESNYLSHQILHREPSVFLR